jgi:cell division septation protein DedD
VDRPEVDRPGAPAMRATTTAQTPWAVQVGAFRDPEEAWDMLDTIVRAMGSDVTGEDARVAVAGPASDTLYRARLNAATESAARALCGTLQERGFECFVDGPGGED